MLWLFWLMLMLLIAAAPGIYLVLEQRAHVRAKADIRESAGDPSTEYLH